jgi:hypothetical protein
MGVDMDMDSEEGSRRKGRRAGSHRTLERGREMRVARRGAGQPVPSARAWTHGM